MEHRINQMKRIEWVPVSERLPEDVGLKLVTVKNKREQRNIDCAWCGDQGIWHGCGNMAEVTAWADMPDPYMEEVDEKYCKEHEVADFYGLKHQMNKMVEELGELIAALSRGQEEGIIEELADIKLMSIQIEYLMDIGDKIKEMIDFKLNRTMKQVQRLKDNGYERWEWN